MNNFLAQILNAERLDQLNRLLDNFSQATGTVATITAKDGKVITNLCGFSLFTAFSGEGKSESLVPQNKSIHLDDHFAISRLPLSHAGKSVGYVCCGYPAVQQNARSSFGPAGDTDGERAQASVTLLRLIIQREIDRYAANVQTVTPAVAPAPAVIHFPETPVQKQEAVNDSLARINKIKTSNKEINDALIYIEQHLNQNISLEEVAQRVYLSSFYFSKLFKKATQMNFSDYLAAKKIKRAMVLLSDTTTPVKQISQRLGFSQTSYFSKTFKKYTNTTPSDFRKSSQ